MPSSSSPSLCSHCDRWRSVRFANVWPPTCSPFVTLSTLSTILFLLLPNDLLINNNSPSDNNDEDNTQSDQFCRIGEIGQQSMAELRPAYGWIPTAIIPVAEEFSCGGDPFSFTAASLISISCHRDQIHLCCEHHDVCYDQRNISQSLCDNIFCDCLDRIPSSPYCAHIAHPGLCLATRTFGHLFHWTSYCTSSSGDCATSVVVGRSEEANGTKTVVNNGDGINDDELAADVLR